MFSRVFQVTAVAFAAAAAGALPPARRAPEPEVPRDTITIPASIRDEHMELLAGLLAAGAERGPVGEAARELTRTLQPHFDREERIALPPLGLLRPLAEDRVPADAEEVLPLTDSLRAELPRMLAEHREIEAAIARFESVARAEMVHRYDMLAVSLRRHARSEEEVLYPAAVLVGDLVRARAAGFRRR
jgi:hypothetical protein